MYNSLSARTHSLPLALTKEILAANFVAFSLPFYGFSHASSDVGVAQRQKKGIFEQRRILGYSGGRSFFSSFYAVATASGALFAVIMSEINCLFFLRSFRVADFIWGTKGPTLDGNMKTML